MKLCFWSLLASPVRLVSRCQFSTKKRMLSRLPHFAIWGICRFNGSDLHRALFTHNYITARLGLLTFTKTVARASVVLACTGWNPVDGSTAPRCLCRGAGILFWEKTGVLIFSSSDGDLRDYICATVQAVLSVRVVFPWDHFEPRRGSTTRKVTCCRL